MQRAACLDKVFPPNMSQLSQQKTQPLVYFSTAGFNQLPVLMLKAGEKTEIV
jgi:hypothetical protein